MTVLSREADSAVLVTVDDSANVIRETAAAKLNADLSASADVAAAVAQPMLANTAMSFLGFLLNGPGFILDPVEAHALLVESRNAEIVKPYISGKDIADRPRQAYVMDFGPRSLEEAKAYPVLYNLVVDRVKPVRDANRDRGIRENWWRFHRIRGELRTGLHGLLRFIVTPETTKHRYFLFLDQSTAPDHSLVCITSEDASHLGVLSSHVHLCWALAAGGRLGVGNDPRYNKGRCFDPFPFPDLSSELRAKIGDVAERLDRHRKDALARDERVTMTGMYNVVEKLRSGEVLTTKEREVHEIAACGVLRDFHDSLDSLVAEAYGWPWPMERDEILARLVALHDERVAEEKQGRVRWLRPEYQVPRFGKGQAAPAAAAGPTLPGEPAPASGATDGKRPWPGSAIEQIAQLKALVTAAPASAEEAAAAFGRAPAELVRRHLETLVLVGEVRQDEHGRFAAVAEPL
jgi:hypothetical protein